VAVERFSYDPGGRCLIWIKRGRTWPLILRKAARRRWR